MTAHRIEIKRSGEGVVGTCACRARQAQPVPSRQEAEDWGMKHLDLVQRARAGEPRLTDRKYLEYLDEQAANTSLPRHERDQWQQLADELRPRVAQRGAVEDAEPLF